MTPRFTKQSEEFKNKEIADRCKGMGNGTVHLVKINKFVGCLSLVEQQKYRCGDTSEKKMKSKVVMLIEGGQSS